MAVLLKCLAQQQQAVHSVSVTLRGKWVVCCGNGQTYLAVPVPHCGAGSACVSAARAPSQELRQTSVSAVSAYC
jgi:hypothetical protein